MSRRIRRMRRRLHRRDVRGEPLTLLVGDRYPGETIEALLRGIYRYRSELAPLVVGAAIGLAAPFLHARCPGWAPLVALFALGASALLWVQRLTPGLRRVERAYASSVTAVGGLWLAAATAVGPGRAPLPALLIVSTLAAAVPWWWHRRRRARVRVERTLEAWPDIAEAVGLNGSRVMSAVVDLWGWRARIGLRRGQTASDVITKVPALESGLGTRPGAVRVEPDTARADHCLIRVLDTDPHARAIPWPATTPDAEPPTVTAPIPLGLFEDASPVTAILAHRHVLIGGVAGAGKSGVLNAILASLTGCSDVVLWGVDLKGGMELGPWSPCLDRLATTPAQAAELLAGAVAILDARATQLADNGQRLWQPSRAEPALVVIIDEYAELSDHAPEAAGHADSLARRGRAVAATLLVATQRPTQKAMGSGAVRSQMDVRVCLRVRERRDVDLVLGQGMLAAGWHAHTLDAPGKFLISTPEHTTPRRARAYLLTDTDVTTLVGRHAPTRPALDNASRAAADDAAPAPDPDDQPRVFPRPRRSSETLADPGPAEREDPDTALLSALRQAPPDGASVPDLMAATGMRRTWVYDRLQDHATHGRAAQVSRGRWRAHHPKP